MTGTLTEPLRKRHEELRPQIERIGATARLIPELNHAARVAALQPILTFLGGELSRHAEAEERWLYPEVARRLGHPLATATMRLDHTILRERIAELAADDGRDSDVLQETLYGIEALLLAHLRKEEELYLPQLEDGKSAQTIAEIEQAMARFEAGRPELRAVTPIDVDRKEYPFSGTDLARLVFLLRYAVPAPSSHNTQPWLVRTADDALLLHADRTRALPVVDPDDRELEISCGAFLHHLRQAIRQHGHLDEVELLPDSDNPDLLATVRLGAEQRPTYEERLLFWAIAKRHTNRRPFTPDPLPDELVAELVAAAEAERAWLAIIEGDDRKALADLVEDADRRQLQDPQFRRELAAWIHTDRHETDDGMPAEAVALPKLLRRAGPLAVRTFDVGKGAAAHHAKLIQASPLLAVLGTDRDTTLDRLVAGQALSHVLLRATQDEIAASFLNQPLEVPELRPRVAELTGREGVPQLVLRLGRGPDVRPTARRPVGEILLT